MRILVLTPYLYGTTPGTRSSVELWERPLAQAGIELVYAPFEDDRLHEIIYQPGHTAAKVAAMVRAYGRRFHTMRELGDYDAVVVYREAALIGPELFERWVARRGLPIIYQLDDPLYVPYRSPSNGYLSYLKFFGKVGRIARISAVTIVNSPQHREYVSRYTDRIRYIPILVDGDVFTPTARPASDGPVCVGWTGSPTTAVNLQTIASTLRRLGDRADVALRFIGGASYDLPGVTFQQRPWTAASEVDELRALQVGLLPLPTDEWTKRKFYMKLIQYMSLGIPPVCTPLGANPDVVQHGVNGMLASSEREWDEALELLVGDRDARERMGADAARTAHAGYTIQARAADVVEAFQSALAARPAQFTRTAPPRGPTPKPTGS